MKRILKQLLIVALVFNISCVDLEEDPPQQLKDEYFQDLNALRRSINGTYRELIANNWEKSIQVASFRVPLMGADDFTTLSGNNKEEWRQFDQFYQNAANGRLIRSTWGLIYDIIRQANWDIEGGALLQGLEPQEEIDALVAEAYFLRGWSYFWLTRIFGEIPIVKTTDVDDQSYQLERNGLADCYNQILSDFEFAAVHLPEQQPDYGYVNRWMAKAMLAEVHLTMAGWPMNETSNYTLAMDYAKDVIDNGPYALLENYGDLFLQENENNSEIVWALSLCPREDCGTGWTGSWAAQGTKPAELSGWQDTYIELSFFERYPEGPRKDFNFLTRLKVESRAPEDTLFYINSLNDTIRYKYIDYTDFSTGHTYLKKYWDGFYDSELVADDVDQNRTAQSPMDIPMIRLAKVNLIYAEAQARADASPSAESYELLNQIRRRGRGFGLNDVGSAADILPGTLSVDDFVREVVDEKGWELVGELNRWFDLIRTERVEEVNALRSDGEPLKIQNAITKQYYLAPIPANEILLNPRLTQNPGY